MHGNMVSVTEIITIIKLKCALLEWMYDESETHKFERFFIWLQRFSLEFSMLLHLLVHINDFHTKQIIWLLTKSELNSNPMLCMKMCECYHFSLQVISRWQYCRRLQYKLSHCVECGVKRWCYNLQQYSLNNILMDPKSNLKHITKNHVPEFLSTIINNQK